MREIRELLGPYGIEPVSAAELDLPEPDEIGTTFIDNADLKARAAADLSGLPALADDSGLCVEALGDRPGIFSARWAVPDAHVDPVAGPGEVSGERDFDLAMRRVRTSWRRSARRRAATPISSARWRVCWPDGHSEWFEGRVDGTLTFPPRGANGFGYDPIFVPAGHEQTFGEMDPAAKHAMSHRADAFRKLVAALL